MRVPSNHTMKPYRVMTAWMMLAWLAFGGGARAQPQTNLVVVRKTFKSSSQRHAQPVPPLRPGLYESHPYTCIILVPEIHADERAIANATVHGVTAMPIIKPNLWLVPRSPGKSRPSVNAR